MINENISLLLFNIIFITLFIISFISIKKNVNYFAILITVLLWGIIPWPFYYLINLNSALMISFVRLLISTIFGFLFIFVLLILNKFSNVSWFQYNVVDLKNNLKSNVPVKSMRIEGQKTRRFPYILYYFILGICYFLSILFYFLSYEFLGVIFSSIINTVIVMVLVAMWTLLRKEESMDTIKFSYLLILVIAGIITIISAPINPLLNTSIYGFVSLALTIIFWFLFIIVSGFDDYTHYEKSRVLRFKGKSTNFQFTKSLVKVSFFFLFSLISLILFTFIFNFLPISGTFIKDEIQLFLSELQYLPFIFSNRWVWVIGIECTILPYIIYFLSQRNWPSRSLKWDQWVSILAIFEPLASIFIGLFIGGETNFNLVLLSMAMILMVVVMILRYYHEKNSLKSVIFIKAKQNEIVDLISRLKYNPNISEIKTITGEYDILLRTFFQSYFKLKRFLDRLKRLSCVLEIDHNIEFEIKRKIK